MATLWVEYACTLLTPWVRLAKSESSLAVPNFQFACTKLLVCLWQTYEVVCFPGALSVILTATNLNKSDFDTVMIIAVAVSVEETQRGIGSPRDVCQNSPCPTVP